MSTSFSICPFSSYPTPLLNESRSPRVVNLLAGGKESPIDEDDLSLNNPKNFSVRSSNFHSTTMLTLSMEHFASENPRISFAHQFPGLVATPLFYCISSGFRGMVFRHFVAPVVKLFARDIDEAGQRGLFTATSARYSVDDGVVPLAGRLQKAERSKGGVSCSTRTAIPSTMRNSLRITGGEALIKEFGLTPRRFLLAFGDDTRLKRSGNESR